MATLPAHPTWAGFNPSSGAKCGAVTPKAWIS